MYTCSKYDLDKDIYSSYVMIERVIIAIDKLMFQSELAIEYFFFGIVNLLMSVNVVQLKLIHHIYYRIHLLYHDDKSV